MIRILAFLLLLLPAPALAELRPQGLMWNRSGLPATLPLQVRTDPGRDWYLTLVRPDTGQAVLAAYVRGGTVFRVLVPPGDYFVRFAYGNGWRGETALFGPGTGHLEIDGPLHFGVEGTSRRVGHLIDLRREANTVQLFGLCRAQDTREAADLTSTRPRAGPGLTPQPLPKTDLPPTRRPTQVLPPPDQPPPTTPEGALPPFARPFTERPRLPAVAALPVGQGGGFTVPRPRASADARQRPSWKICD